MPAQLLARDVVIGALKPLLTDPKIAKVAQNATYDAAHPPAATGSSCRPIAFDTMVGAYLIDPDRGRFDLKIALQEVARPRHDPL